MSKVQENIKLDETKSKEWIGKGRQNCDNKTRTHKVWDVLYTYKRRQQYPAQTWTTQAFICTWIKTRTKRSVTRVPNTRQQFQPVVCIKQWPYVCCLRQILCFVNTEDKSLRLWTRCLLHFHSLHMICHSGKYPKK